MTTRWICASAPTRIDFAGGPTDVDPFRSSEGGFVVSAALSLRATAWVADRPDADMVITSMDLKVTDRFRPHEDRLPAPGIAMLHAAAQHVGRRDGIEIRTLIDAPAGSGLGASAALGVALLAALGMSRSGVATSAEQLVTDALHVERSMLGNAGGEQDQYLAALGGFLALTFGRGSVTIDRLRVSPAIKSELVERSLLCYTGEPRLSGSIHAEINARYEARESSTVESLRRVKRVAQNIAKDLVDGRLDAFGEHLQESGQCQADLFPGIVPDRIRRLQAELRTKGVLGSKLAGAGGGGYLYMFVEPDSRRQVEQALQRWGYPTRSVEFEDNGVRFTTSDPPAG